MSGFFHRLKDALGAEVDIVSGNTLNDDGFSRGVINDRMLLYEVRHRRSPRIVMHREHVEQDISRFGDGIEDFTGDPSHQRSTAK